VESKYIDIIIMVDWREYILFIRRRKRRVVVKSTCLSEECENIFEHPSTTVRYYCSKKRRYLARGSKRARRLAAKLP
jgi:hypothetical protein